MIWTPSLSPENVTKSVKIYDATIAYTRWPRYVVPEDGILEEFPQGNPEFVSLVNLRTYKNREGNEFRTRTGRTPVKNISFTDFSYELRKARRKYEILQYKQDKYISTSEKWQDIVRSKKISQAQLRLMSISNTIENCKDTIDNIEVSKIPYLTTL